MSKYELPPSEPFNFAEWETGQLRLQTRQLIDRKEATPIPRQREELDRTIGHAAFELWYRAHWEPQHADIAELQPIEISA